METKPTITFYGAAGSVTGSNFLFTVGGKKILVDCGMFQGSPEDTLKNFDPFPYNPKDIDMLIVTHAHADHIGRIPKLFKDGFAGPVYSTAPTRELAGIMLADSVRILDQFSEDRGIDSLYTERDIATAFTDWKAIPYHGSVDILPGVSFLLRDAGHILGSAMVEFVYHGKKVVFTGDLGNSPAPLIRDTEVLADVDYLLMESVYGDRNHERTETRTSDLEQIIEDTDQKGGTLMIPVFSLERTQELLFELNTLIENNRIPKVPVFVDSPLAIAVTEVFRKSYDYFNETTKALIDAGDDVFSFSGLKLTPEREDSKAINAIPGSKIILAGSGMAHAGRMTHHLKRYLSGKNNTLLYVGYQAVGTLGRIIQDGAKSVTIQGDRVAIKARIATISGYSGHRDSDNLVAFVEPIAHSVKEVFCVMGEKKSALHLVQRLRDTLGVKAIAPDEGTTVTLDL